MTKSTILEVRFTNNNKYHIVQSFPQLLEIPWKLVIDRDGLEAETKCSFDPLPQHLSVTAALIVGQMVMRGHRISKHLEKIPVSASLNDYFFEAFMDPAGQCTIRIRKYGSGHQLIPYPVIGSDAAQGVAANIASVITAEDEISPVNRMGILASGGTRNEAPASPPSRTSSTAEHPQG